MWAAVHTLIGAILARSLEGRRAYLKYPLLASTCFIIHLYLDSIPFVWGYHAIEELPLGLHALVYFWNAALILALLLIYRRIALEGLIFGWLLVDWEHALGWHYLHDTLNYVGKLPYGGVWLELLLAALLLAIAIPAGRRFEVKRRLRRILKR